MPRLNNRNRASSRRRALIALFTVSVALLGGGQTLAPAPAGAVVKEGNECSDSSWSWLECEEANEGGGDGGGIVFEPSTPVDEEVEEELDEVEEAIAEQELQDEAEKKEKASEEQALSEKRERERREEEEHPTSGEIEQRLGAIAEAEREGAEQRRRESDERWERERRDREREGYICLDDPPACLMPDVIRDFEVVEFNGLKTFNKRKSRAARTPRGAQRKTAGSRGRGVGNHVRDRSSSAFASS